MNAKQLIEQLTPLEWNILKHRLFAGDGCTYFSNFEEDIARGELTPSVSRRRLAAADRLGEKASAYVGHAVKVTRC